MNHKKIIVYFLLLVVYLGGCATTVDKSATELSTNVTSLTAVVAPALSEPVQELVAFDPPVNAAFAGPRRLSEFSTAFKHATKSRAHNITLASSAINNKVVLPGDSFSFNEAVGPTTKKNGFMLGRIFIKGKDAKGYGGGVCQVSSTLFNAVDQAGLTVTERHFHSKPVGYVKKDRDAATSYGTLDFKFVNNKPFPVRINSFTDADKETVFVAIEAI